MRFKLFASIFLAACLVSGLAFAAKKVIFFTATPVPTTNEKAAITTLNGQAAAPLRVVVRSYRKALLRTTPESSDYVAGTIPPNYRDGGTDAGTPLAPVYDPTDPPDPTTLVSAQAVVRDGDTIAIPGGGSITVAVSSNTITVSAYVAPDGGT